MRRLAFAAVCGTLVLAACSDQSPTEPTAPPPEQVITPSCRPTTHFPIVQVSALILKVFPKGNLQLEALLRGAAIALFWETCKKTQAQRGAVDFVNFMNANASRLTGTPTQRNTLINLIFNGVGLPFTVPTDSPNDFGVGIFDPAKTTNTLIKTNSNVALVEFEPGSFNEVTLIKIARLTDAFQLTNFDGNQFPPYFDYDAINASGDHVLKNGKKAIVAFCLLDPVYTYPENPRIGHNPVVGAPGFPFEILDAVNLHTERPDLEAALHCGNLVPNTVIIGGFGQGLPGLANAAWRTGRYYMTPAVQTLLLPEALHAATLAVGTLPPPAGRLPSLSPLGIVEATGNHLSFTEDPSTNNTSDGNYFKGVTLDTCGDGCYPAVEMLNGSGARVGAGSSVTVSLIQTAGSGGVLNGTLTQPVPYFVSGETTFIQSTEFNDLTISAPGTYKLKFTAPGADPITSAEFKVYTMAFTVQPFATAGHTFSELEFLGQTVAGFDNPVVQVSIVDFANAVVTTANDRIEMAVTTGSLNGTTSVNANSGVASFTEIVVSETTQQQGLKVGVESNETGVSLQASASYFGTNPVQATSTTFNVTNAP